MAISSIYIKNMVCNRCIMVVENIFKSLDVEPVSVTLGEVKLLNDMPSDKLSLLNSKLIDNGFELIDDKKRLIYEQIKSIVIEQIHHQSDFDLKINWSNFLQEKLDLDYAFLSTLFSSINGTTLEQFIIKHKIEKVKEYLFYDELSVKEIAFKLGYSSVAHLSTQFKKMTGLTPTEFKKSKDNSKRLFLDKI